MKTKLMLTVVSTLALFFSGCYTQIATQREYDQSGVTADQYDSTSYDSTSNTTVNNIYLNDDGSISPRYHYGFRYYSPGYSSFSIGLGWGPGGYYDPWMDPWYNPWDPFYQPYYWGWGAGFYYNYPQPWYGYHGFTDYSPGWHNHQADFITDRWRNSRGFGATRSGYNGSGIYGGGYGGTNYNPSQPVGIYRGNGSTRVSAPVIPARTSPASIPSTTSAPSTNPTGRQPEGTNRGSGATRSGFGNPTWGGTPAATPAPTRTAPNAPANPGTRAVAPGRTQPNRNPVQGVAPNNRPRNNPGNQVRPQTNPSPRYNQPPRNSNPAPRYNPSPRYNPPARTNEAPRNFTPPPRNEGGNRDNGNRSSGERRH